MGIISKYDTKQKKVPEWLNSFVIVKKPNGKLCVCLDPTDLNQYIIRPYISTVSWPYRPEPIHCKTLTLNL